MKALSKYKAWPPVGHLSAGYDRIHSSPPFKPRPLYLSVDKVSLTPWAWFPPQ